MNEQKPPRIKTRRTIYGFIIEIDSSSWAELMTALGTAIEHSDRERAASLRKLRTALNRQEGSGQ